VLLSLIGFVISEVQDCSTDRIIGDSRLIHNNNFWVLVTVHSEHNVKKENQHDASNSMFIIKLSISTCFGHHYAHHQESKTVSYCMRCSAWLCRLWTRPQPTTACTPRQNTACSWTRSYSPDDGYNDARNMLR